MGLLWFSISAFAEPVYIETIIPKKFGVTKDYNPRFTMLGPNLFIIGHKTDRDQDGRAVNARYRMFDVLSRRGWELRVPKEDYPAAYAETLGKDEGPGTFVHHGNDVTSLIVGRFEGYKLQEKFFYQYNHRTRRFSPLIKLGDRNEHRTIHPLGFDALERYYYFAYAVNEEAAVFDNRALVYEISRINLKNPKVERLLNLQLPRRARQLSLSKVLFSPNGRLLALAEHNEKVYERDSGPAIPPQQVYVIDVEKRTFETYPIPLSAYGNAFSPDSKFLFFGSHELGTIIRINLAEKKIDRRVRAAKTIHEFHMAPSGKTFLVVMNMYLSKRKVVDVRSAETLKLVKSLPVKELFPGCEKSSPGFTGTMDGRTLFSWSCDKPEQKHERVYRLFKAER